MLQALGLCVIPGAWRLFAARRRDAAFIAFSKQVFERDRYTCRFCGFQAEQFQEVVNLDRNYRNNRLFNLATACCFCAQCFFLEAVGKGEGGGGTIVYLPEVTQGDLHGFCHVLFCAMANATTYHADAQAIYRQLKLRSRPVEDRLGEGMSDPATLGQLLMDAQTKRHAAEEQARGHLLLKDLRLLPAYTGFAKQIETWAKDALKEMAA